MSCSLEGSRLHNALADLDNRIGMVRRFADVCTVQGDHVGAAKHRSRRRELVAQRAELVRVKEAWRLRRRLARRGVCLEGSVPS